MKEIVFITPFEELELLVKEIINLKKYSNIEVVLGNLSEGVEVAKKVVKEGASVIISRGGTYKMIKNEINIPVVELQISSFDILRAFKELRYYKNKKICIAGYDNIIWGGEIIGEILNLDIAKVKIENEKSANKIIKRYVDEGIEIFIGDTIGAETSRKLGCKSYIIESGRESIIFAIQEARRILKGIKFEKKRAEKFKTIMNFIGDGIIAIDDEGKIDIFNSKAEKMLGINGEMVIGKDVNDILKNQNLKEILNTGEMELGEIKDFGKIKIATNTIPIIVDDKITGVVQTIEDISKIQDLEQKIRLKLQKKGFVAKYNFNNIIYKSEEMKECIDRAEIYSNYDSPLLILGESGVGKELFAQGVHNNSSRKNSPFVAINCAAIAQNLIESELFGYVDGAFTGSAKGGKLGVFELAHNGTIFLDEIGELPLELQGRFLRVIQEKEVKRIGDDKVIPIDVRIITATNRDLKDMIDKGKFREDLYYRINILTLIVPNLNNRKGDIDILSKEFIKKYCEKYNKKIKEISIEAKNHLENHKYKGNVRELENIIERAVVLCNKEKIELKDIILEESKSCNNFFYKNKTLKEIEDEYIEKVIDECNGNLSKASKILNINRTTLWRRKNTSE